ncbi:Spindle-body formation-associated protein [Penicillium lagena]|uniref:Spindle-body formation-associated protein n=1 Tax=Penicillium lagena TaxID=94218 RepID=UPI00253FD414|nr:Spindle-body formation-associated protein [Penicillium lagena]KAJ5619048.1 Spindle-body formation-associated protein [Penicillium lagena]
MLDWMTGSEQPDNSRLLEPPETPAPVFAIRAFKSALFGTPAAEEEEERVSQPKKTLGHQRSKSDSAPSPARNVVEDESSKALNGDAINPGSPTKSILVTPGTISNRRKTVSFGESVVDNEGKRNGSSNKLVKTPPNPSGNLSIQWMSGSSDGSSKPRSKLTQTLLNARDNASKNGKSPQSSPAKSPTRSRTKEDTSNEDITINLEEPCSESGKYWKTEFDNYRIRTNREIKKLIHYRSIAKSYARKKDSEALRLADKLREEEDKVNEMERQVSQLASTMVESGSPADKEHLIQDLTKQTALALQYKQQVSDLRKLLEQHNVVSGDMVDEPDEPAPRNSTDESRQTQLALNQANAKLAEIKCQPTDLTTLQDLARSSEKKAQELEKENTQLKQTLARVKQEMSRYEGRRKDKESKFKSREAKLEARIQEYRDRLRTTTQEHRKSEETLRITFDEERQCMQNQIDLLKLRVAATEQYSFRPEGRHSLSPRKNYTGVQVQDFGGHNAMLEISEDATEDLDAPPSPSPRSQGRFTRHSTIGAVDFRRAAREIAAEDDEVTHYLNEILPKPHQTRTYHNADLAAMPPSSPPDAAALKLHSHSQGRAKYLHTGEDGQRTYRSRYLTETDERGQVQTYAHHRQRSPIKSTLDSISGPPASRTGAYAGSTIAGGERVGKRYGLSDLQSEYLSPERAAAARSRLIQKHDSRKSRALGKENVRVALTSGAGAG